jgi:hypothetical protein
MARTSGTRRLIKEGMQKLALVTGAGAGAPDADDVCPGVGAAGGTGCMPIGAGLSYINDAITETQKTKNCIKGLQCGP